MKIELKNIKISKLASQETLCFKATLYINGERAAMVENEGFGGCNSYDFDDDTLGQRFFAYCKSLPPTQHEIYGSLNMDADGVVDELLAKYETEKQYKSWCRKETVFRLKGDKSGVFRTLKIPYSQKAKDFIVSNYGDQVESVLNETIGQKV